jgi:hypothetical protein
METFVNLISIFQIYGSLWLNYWMFLITSFFIYTETDYHIQLVSLFILCLTAIEYSYYNKNHIAKIIGDDYNLMYGITLILFFLVNVLELFLSFYIILLDPIHLWYCYFLNIKVLLVVILSTLILITLLFEENRKYYHKYINLYSSVLTFNTTTPL